MECLVRCYTAVEVSCYSSSTWVYLVPFSDSTCRYTVWCPTLSKTPPSGFSYLLYRRGMEMYNEQRRGMEMYNEYHYGFMGSLYWVFGRKRPPTTCLEGCPTGWALQESPYSQRVCPLAVGITSLLALTWILFSGLIWWPAINRKIYLESFRTPSSCLFLPLRYPGKLVYFSPFQTAKPVLAYLSWRDLITHSRSVK